MKGIVFTEFLEMVEERYSAVFKPSFVTPGVLAEGLAEAQVRFPSVPIVFCETRPLAQEWTYRFLGAAVAHHLEDEPARALAAALPAATPLRAGDPSPSEVRAWARANGHEVSSKGRIPAAVRSAFDEAQRAAR